MQLLIRVFISMRNINKIKSDERLSKSNYRSRRNYSIESAILEKLLIFNHNQLGMKSTICNLIDFQSCYDRQLLKIGSIVEEVTRQNRQVMLLFTKIILIFKHYINISFCISKSFYKGNEIHLGGIE